ncbi:hypothetical protein Sj15T_13040 [Sphingobium sp. TA15]|uniref:DUF2285 domain-containing protein n=1 Tax=Sphingobium TaxID=165695 RepID=UPI0020A56FC5|nr:DUF2285 domain-containing protein [Sphingobium indicum]BDD66283.1 hypothetical protein Sj15T_13040 [Sphingobium sp. TA15]
MDPLQAPATAPVFWLPQEDTSVVILASAPDVLARETDNSRGVSEVRSDSDGQDAHSLHDLGNSQKIQILRIDAAAGDVPLAAIVPLGIAGFDRLEAVGRLLAALHDRAIPPDTRLTRQQRARARRMLQAIDGARDGATQLEIAQVIFRIGRVTRDEWQVSSVRHTVMSLLRDARAMIAGDYRKLLRHRRSR